MCLKVFYSLDCSIDRSEESSRFKSKCPALPMEFQKSSNKYSTEKQPPEVN